LIAISQCSSKNMRTLWREHFILLLLIWLSTTSLAQDPLPKNCFSFVDESQWSRVLGFNSTSASLSVLVEGAGSSVQTCLRRRSGDIYIVSVVGDLESARYLSATEHGWRGKASVLLLDPPTFAYLVYPGRYRLKLTYCGPESCSDPSLHESVFTDFISVPSSVAPGCEDGATNGTGLEERDAQVEQMTASFHFSFPPCSVHSYDSANVSLFSANNRDECCADCNGATLVYEDNVPVMLTNREEDEEAMIRYTSPRLRGDRYYCVSITLSHISCRLATLRQENICYLRASIPVWVPAVPLISTIIPFCTSHFACAWLYVTVAGCLFLFTSLCLAILLLRCCRRRKSGKPGDEVDFAGERELHEVQQERVSWGSLHKEWESGEEKARGKILMLYSPDTKLFKELQEALKSFLELACHCDIYDLFDDALFDTIALDPSEWLQEFVNDQDVKIVVISSIGAFHRQLALKGSMPLNLPSGLSDNILDGLFTSGLRFISNYPSLAASGRVATARYEMLHLTEEAYKLAPPLASPPVREFLVPTQLHELFCWVHGLQPLDVMGKPWANYHLEMQLLQDALKLARRDRGVVSNYTSGSNIGNNGGTML